METRFSTDTQSRLASFVLEGVLLVTEATVSVEVEGLEGHIKNSFRGPSPRSYL